MLADGTPYGDHLGCATAAASAAGLVLPACVNFCSDARRINLYARAPYQAGSVHRVWEFTRDEAAELRQQVERRSMRVFSEWLHEDGVAFLVSPR